MDDYANIRLDIFIPLLFLIAIAIIGAFWAIKGRRHELNLKASQVELDAKKLRAEEQVRHETAQRCANPPKAAPAESEGYIVVEMSENERSTFYDLLRGFEDYARLKGYQINFSIDASINGRIGFKFTIRDRGFDVGPERVSQDFKEYVLQAANNDFDSLDRLPVMSSASEHKLLLTSMKQRISFLQERYRLSQNAVLFYEGLINNVRAISANSAPSVIVQTGGVMDSYKAVNSSRFQQGSNSSYSDSSVNIDIGQSFNDKQVRITALDEMIKQLETSGVHAEPAIKARRELGKVRDELAESEHPDRSTMTKWMENAKKLMSTAALSYEVAETAKKLWVMFGM